jgi:DNA-binding transcriptional MerR regulator
MRTSLKSVPSRPSSAILPSASSLRPDGSTVLRIGDLAARAGVSADTLRYYERRGLLKPSGRRASGYREYPPEAAVIVHFIKHAQALGFTLAEVDELLRLRRSSGRRGAGLEVRDVAVAKISEIDDKIRMLGTLRGALAELVVECEQTCRVDSAASDPLNCPIIAALSVNETHARDIEGSQ